MFKVILIALLVLTSSGHASVTAAWKVPIERVVPDHQNNSEARKLEKPPGESAFFQAGDELWDVAKAIDWLIYQPQPLDDPFGVPEEEPVEVKWQGEWLVWNARSQMMVASGAWNDLLLVQEILDFKEMLIVLRTRVDLVAGGGQAAEKHSVSLVSRGGEKATMELNGLKVAVEANPPSKSSGLIGASFQVSWPAGIQESRWEIATAVTLEDGKRLRLARQGAWELFVTVASELIDGTPLIEARWLEAREGLLPWRLHGDHQHVVRKQLGEERVLGIYPIDEDNWARTLDHLKLDQLPDLEAPAELAPWAPGPLVDARKVVEEFGIKLSGTGSFAGVDLLGHRAFVIADPANQDLAEQAFTFGDCSALHPIWIGTNPESGGWGLACRSGERARISRSGGDGKGLMFEVEPTQGGDGLIFDLGYTFDVVSGESSMGRLESRTMMLKDKPQVVGTGSIAPDQEVKVIVTTSESRE